MSVSMIENHDALDQYLEMFGDDGNEFISDIIETFIVDVPKNFELLDQSKASADFATFRRAAHSLKSNCATVGALSLANEFAKLEQAGADQNLNSIGDLIDKCRLDFQKLQIELELKKDSLQ